MFNKRILITGSAGFLGTNIKKRLEKNNIEVIVFDIKNDFAEDIRNIEYLDKIFSKTNPDIVIHLAARPGVRKSAVVPDEYITTNIIGTKNVLEMSKKYKVNKVLVASSSSVYGEQPNVLLKEGVFCENPKSIYAMTKKSVETLCKLYSSDIPVYVFRPFSVYGSNGRPDMAIGKLTNIVKNGGVFKKYGDGNSVRTYTHIDDFVDFVEKLLCFEGNNYEVFNVGGAEKISLNKLLEIVKIIKPEIQIEQVEFNDLDVNSSCANIEKAKKLLDWKPTRIFEYEIKKLFICQQV